MGRNNSYVTPLVKSKNDDNVYDVLDVIFQRVSEEMFQMYIMM